MRRIIRVLMVVALMVVLMVTVVSPAFADPPEKWGHTCGGPTHGPDKNGVPKDGNCGFHYSPDNR